MAPEVIGLLSIVLLLILLGLGMWIGAATAIAGAIGMIAIRGFGQAALLVEMLPYNTVVDYSLTVIPMFGLMGMIIANTGIGSDMYDSAYKWIGWTRGGLASATVLACGGMGAITGASTAGIMVLSKIALPEMRKYKYSDILSFGSIAAGATVSVLIPPSIPFIIYGIMTETGVGQLFIAGIIPGLLSVTAYMALVYILCLRNPSMGPAGEKTSFKEKILSLKGVWPILFLFILVIGGIYGGVFTSTEAGAIGAIGAILISIVTRRITLKSFYDSVVETGKMTGIIITVMIGFELFSQLMTVSRIPQWIGEFIVGLGIPTYGVLAALALVYLVMGCLMPAPAIIMLTMPILFPVVSALGVNPIWFGVLVVKLCEIGSITPPVGINCLLMSGVTRVSVTKIYKASLPFLISDLAVVVILMAFPVLSTFLPSLM